MFKKAFKMHKYSGKYFYCYCTKSSHFSHILTEVLKNNVHIETSISFASSMRQS
jgi:arginine decarboxylase